MGIEIERKFLVDASQWHPTSQGTTLSQGYLNLEPERTVRVRIADAEAFLTIKGKNTGISRAEFEYAIPVSDATELLKLCATPPLEKTRYRVEHAGFMWDVDVFSGANAGLIIAEIELPNPDALFALPKWVGTEVSNDTRYYNSYLNQHPYTTWSQHESK